MTILVLKVDFESNIMAPALKVLFRLRIIDSVAMCMFDILNFGITNEKGLLLKQKIMIDTERIANIKKNTLLTSFTDAMI